MKILILIILHVTLTMIPSQTKCSYENKISLLRPSLRSFVIRLFKKMRDILRFEETQAKLLEMLKTQELKEKEKEAKAMKKNDEEIKSNQKNVGSNNEETSLFKKFFHFERI